MRRPIAVLIGLLVACGIIVGGAAAAQANGTGFCTLPGGTVYFAVYESSENVVSDVTINSQTQLSTTGSTWTSYAASTGNVYESGIYVLRDPQVIGDGYWNYFWDRHPYKNSGVDRIKFVAKDTHGSSCTTNVYF